MGIDAKLAVILPSSPPSPAQLRSWSWWLCSSVGAEKFWSFGGTGVFSHNENERADLYELSVGTRYYGPGYERGDILGLCSIAEWLEQNIPGCLILYGSDHSDAWETFDEAKRKKLKAHLYSQSGRAYFNYSSASDDGIPRPPPCQSCIPEAGPVRNGWGKDYALFSCHGCGKKFKTTDGGKTWGKHNPDRP